MQYVNISTAARVCRVDRRQIERLLKQGAFPGAVRSEGVGGPWLIPADELAEAGLTVDRGKLQAFERSIRQSVKG